MGSGGMVKHEPEWVSGGDIKEVEMSHARIERRENLSDSVLQLYPVGSRCFWHASELRSGNNQSV